jgi:hypothetical protein
VPSPIRLFADRMARDTARACLRFGRLASVRRWLIVSDGGGESIWRACGRWTDGMGDSRLPSGDPDGPRRRRCDPPEPRPTTLSR